MVGAFFVVVGGHEGLLAGRASEQIVGVLVFAAGAMLALAAIVEIAGPRSPFRSVSAYGFLVGVLPGLTMAAVQVTSYPHWPRMAIWIATAAVPVAGLVQYFRSGMRLRSGWSASSSGTMVALLAALLPIAGVAFAGEANPSILDLELNVSVVGHRQDPAQGRIALVNAELATTNISKRRLVVIASAYTVRSVASEIRKDAFVGDPYPTLKTEIASSDYSSRFEQPWKPSLVEVGHEIFVPGDYLEPGQHDVTNILVPVPESSGNTAEVVISVATAYADRLRLGDSKAVDETGGDLVSQTWGLRSTGWINWMVLGERQLDIRYWLKPNDNGDELDFDYLTGRAGHRPTETEYDEKVENLYGLGWTACYSAIALDVEPEGKAD